MENTCKLCIYFTSYQDDYYDPLEPDDEGFCKGNPMNDGHTFSNSICDKFKAKYGKSTLETVMPIIKVL
jgi:hypothetical protein